MKYTVNIPSGQSKIEAGSREEAIRQGFTEYIQELQSLLDSGDAFSIPAICKHDVVVAPVELRKKAYFDSNRLVAPGTVI